MFKISKFFLIVAILNVAIVTVSTLFPFIVGKYAWFRSAVDLALIFFLLGILFNPGAKIFIERAAKLFRTPLVLAVSAFVLMFLLACAFGINPANSFWSNFERGEGGLQILHLYVFFLLLSILFCEEKDWRRMLGWFLVAGLLMSFYGFAAALGWKGFIGAQFSDPGFRFQGSIGNPAYVATYLIFIFFYASYLFLGRYRKNLKSPVAIAILLSVLVFIPVFVLAATRGAFVALLAAAAVSILYFAYVHRGWRKWILGAGVVLVVAVLIMVQFKDTPFVKSIPGSRLFDLSFTAQTFRDRSIMWGMAWHGFLARPLFGWGPENFIQVFDRFFDPRYFVPDQSFGAWFDRAHSLIFDYLAETGILGFLSFASIFFVFFWKFFKSQKEDSVTVLGQKSFVEKALVVGLPVAYLTQGLVLFDVLPIYTNVFFFLAFATYLFSPARELEWPQKRKRM